MDQETQSALSNTVTNFRATVRSGGVTLKGFSVNNIANTATTYLSVFGVPAASVVLGTTTPIFRFPIGSQSAVLETANSYNFIGQATTGLSAAVTTTETGTTAPSTAVSVTLYFE